MGIEGGLVSFLHFLWLQLDVNLTGTPTLWSRASLNFPKMKRKHFRRAIKEKSRGYPILVISNTEPYIHKENEDRIECIRSINSYATDEFAQTIKKAFAVTPERFLGGWRNLRSCLREKYLSLGWPNPIWSNPVLIEKVVDYLFDRIGKILGRLRGVERLFLFLDYDGTLTPIVLHPEEACLSKETKSLLMTLKKSPRILLAIVSGRSLTDTRDRVGLKGIYYVGNHGLEVLFPKSKKKALLPNQVVQELKEIVDRLNHQLRNIEGVVIEDKGCILAVHYRNVDLKGVPSILMALKQEIKGSVSPLDLGLGKMVFEIRPKTSINKGTAVLDILDKVDQNKMLPIYIGDDRTDEDAFKVLKGKGITILVGSPGLSSARYYVKDPSEVFQFLKIIQKELRS